MKFSDRQWFEYEMRSMDISREACPACDAKGCLLPHASYDRYLVSLVCGSPVTYTIKINRYRCESCCRTQAMLPSALVPCRSYSLRFILTVLRSYFLNLMTIERLCLTYGIAPSTLYSWKKLFLAQKALWLGTLSDLERSAAVFMDGMDGKMLAGFFGSFRFSFMGRSTVNDKNLPFTGG